MTKETITSTTQEIQDSANLQMKCVATSVLKHHSIWIKNRTRMWWRTGKERTRLFLPMIRNQYQWKKIRQWSQKNTDSKLGRRAWTMWRSLRSSKWTWLWRRKEQCATMKPCSRECKLPLDVVPTEPTTLLTLWRMVKRALLVSCSSWRRYLSWLEAPSSGSTIPLYRQSIVDRVFSQPSLTTYSRRRNLILRLLGLGWRYTKLTYRHRIAIAVWACAASWMSLILTSQFRLTQTNTTQVEHQNLEIDLDWFGNGHIDA